MKRKLLIIVMTVALAILIVLSLYLVQGGTIRIRVTTTTSLYATGLLEHLAYEFTRERDKVVFDFIPVGSGEALKRAARGDACMVFAHAPSLEAKYLASGDLVYGRIFAYNYFVIAGPESDPAEVRKAASAVEAFKNIYIAGEEGKAKFVSRGDNSGTHVKELSIWSRTGLDPRGKPWYLEVGSGMAQTLIVANEEEAYVFSDIGTFLKFKKEGKIPRLVVLYTNDTELINIYSVYLSKHCRGNEREIALAFIEFIAGEAQNLVEYYGVNEYGENLFSPARNKYDWLEEVWRELAER